MIKSYLQEKLDTVKSKDPKFSTVAGRLAEFKENVKDVLNINRTTVYTQVQKNNILHIKGVDIKCFKMHDTELKCLSFPGLNDPKDVRTMLLSPFHGAKYQLKHYRDIKEACSKVKVSKVDSKNKVVYFSSPKGLKILYWENTGLHSILEPKEEVAICLSEIFKWSDVKYMELYLKCIYIESRIHMLDVIPIIGELIGLIPLLLVNIIQTIYYNKIITDNMDNNVKSVGYGKEFASVIEKTNLKRVIDMGKMKEINSIIRAYSSKIDAIIIKYLPKFFKNRNINSKVRSDNLKKELSTIVLNDNDIRMLEEATLEFTMKLNDLGILE
jgi:hypothetical protein